MAPVNVPGLRSMLLGVQLTLLAAIVGAGFPEGGIATLLAGLLALTGTVLVVLGYLGGGVEA